MKHLGCQFISNIWNKSIRYERIACDEPIKKNTEGVTQIETISAKGNANEYLLFFVV